MNKKVILISIDGMRPDAVTACKNQFVEKLKSISSYTFNAKTVFPSVTLPCHMSMFHSVDPSRHGTTTNIYAPQVRPIDGLVEKLNACGKKSFAYYGWEEMRDIARPGSFQKSVYTQIKAFGKCDDILVSYAFDDVKYNPDFIYLYLGDVDDIGGHKFGWMSSEYLGFVDNALSIVERVVEKLGNDYTVIVTADHGGHDRSHGTDLDEDMTIPMFFIGEDFEKGKELSNVSILDIAPTIATVMGVPLDEDWEGKSLT